MAKAMTPPRLRPVSTPPRAKTKNRSLTAMAPGIGMPEMLVVLVLALVVVGPQQLPVLMRRIGRMLAQARGMARDFQASFDELGRETELSDLRKEIEALKRGNPIEESPAKSTRRPRKPRTTRSGN